MNKNHLTTQDLADRWNKSTAWIREQAVADKIPGSWKLGRQWRFDLQKIEAYEVAQRTTKTFQLAPKASKRQQRLAT